MIHESRRGQAAAARLVRHLLLLVPLSAGLPALAADAAAGAGNARAPIEHLSSSRPVATVQGE